ncbi:MAG: outer membrane beta-barrel protein [Aquabacterium sp.]
MKKIIAAAVVALGMGGASAQSFSLGAALGQSNLNIDCTGASACDNDGNGAKVYIGYRVNPFLSVEAGYAHFGTASGAADPGTGTVELKYRSYGAYLAAAGRVALMKDVAASARLGVMKVNTRLTASGAANGSRSDSAFRPLIGLGLEATITQSTWATLNIDFTKSAEVVGDDAGTLRLITLGVRTDF